VDETTWRGAAEHAVSGQKILHIGDFAQRKKHMCRQRGEQGGSGFPTAVWSGGWTGSCHRDAVGGKLPKKRGGCPLAKVVNGNAVEMTSLASSWPHTRKQYRCLHPLLATTTGQRKPAGIAD
jgi:hypothetical protein